jgi:hypothetical protein
LQKTDRRCPPQALEIRRISEREWRIGDGRVDEESPEKILGFIQYRATCYEVLDLSAPLSDAVFDRWDDALNSFTV